MTGWSGSEVNGMARVPIKWGDPRWKSGSEGDLLGPTDAEERKPRERIGLDTQVVWAVNDADWIDVEGHEECPGWVLAPRSISANAEICYLESIVARRKFKGLDGSLHSPWSMLFNAM